ncbi:MAG: class I SAM-dependent methyltransferase [Oligoflexia bacterium]|nr:class I SAM-dependent methyltransferase [Oligoflexia bacterium]
MPVSDYERCDLCQEQCGFDRAQEVRRVNCHVRSHRQDIFTVWRCPSCSSLHSKEAVDLAKYYADYPLKKHKPTIHTHIAYRNRHRLLKRWGLGANNSILDFGCGTGLFVKYMRQRGYQVSGFDAFVPEFSDSQALARNYDAVLSFDVIEHLDRPAELFQQLFDLTAPGGLLVVGTPDASGLDLGAKIPPVELSQPFHRHILSEQALIQIAKRFDLIPEFAFRRSYFDSLIPTVNMRFMWAYLNASGGMLDSMVEPINWGRVLRSPRLIFYALAGYFLYEPGNMIIAFRKPHAEALEVRRAGNQ